MFVEIIAAGSVIIALAVETFLLKKICKGQIVPYPYYLPSQQTRNERIEQ
jgi:hypothetical protein